MMPGPNPKPADRRQRRNRPALVSVPATPAAAPPPPEGLLKASVAAWDALWASPVASTYLESDLPALARLFSLIDERTRISAGIGSERLVAGSQGQPRPHPMYAVVTSLDAEIRQLEDRFGLSPKARMQLGVAFGEAHRSLDALNAEFLERNDDDHEE